MPVRGGAPAVEQAGMRQDERARANRGQAWVRSAADLTASTSSGSIARRGKSSLPATMMVSADSIDDRASVTPSRVPIEVVTSRPSSDAIFSR
jgi:3-polyprenyl-4-hydroxybenzoate decarboxylase